MRTRNNRNQRAHFPFWIGCTHNGAHDCDAKHANCEYFGNSRCIQAADGEDRNARRIGNLRKPFVSDLGTVAGLAWCLEGGPGDSIVDDIWIDCLCLGDGVERYSNQLVPTQELARGDRIAYRRQMDAIYSACSRQCRVAVQRQSCVVGLRDPQQRPCKDHLIILG